MVRFWDASAIVPLLFEKASTPTVKSLTQEDSAMLVWWGTRVELASALARLLRQEKLTPDETDLLRAKLEETWNSSAVVEPSSKIIQEADDLLFKHVLRAGDALQLGAARAALRGEPDGFGFVTLDQRLRAAAATEGFTLYPP